MTTVVLVHGAYAGSSSWDGVVGPLLAQGHSVVSFANPLRGVASDAALLSDLVRSVEGPVVLVGHSYGGAVMTAVATRAEHVVALVYVAGFALETGESAAAASALSPGSTLADTLTTVPLGDGTTDTYIAPEKYHHQFCADLPDEQAALMAVSQRPVTFGALNEPLAGEPLWTSVPSWFLFGELDRNIPAGAHHVMARRAGARRTTEVPGASHVVGISHPDETVRVVQEAVDASVPART
ncbi:alpha/beta fold hydrolase [Microlunatus flavus]|uniref:Pimeloyl-ACP methyl ester carboxylesterase n=1 Tax=Microlunatus flavus TaxID=1036181 RepID=A0A1H9KU63_9ACTN|nr:alpha/beta hydrolase [Microlunatus flavus]SER02333.1 Pimeloyl-ACP methyl ester carboxylesterase [Microlunatus flavus]